jgi:5'(3')-deoxyribonucleotidase
VTKKIFVDMDGVLADFVKGVEGPKYLNAPFVNVQDYNARKVELSNKGLFRDLPKIDGMEKLIDFLLLESLRNDTYWEILTCTGMQNRQKVANDKIAWIREFVDKDVVVTCTFKGVQKSAFAKKGYILIDDTEKNIDAWITAGGIGLLYKDANSCINELKTLLKS